MVDSDSTESDSNGSHSCWKWKLRCFTIFPNSTSPIRIFRHHSSPEENTSVESLGTPTTETHSLSEPRTRAAAEDLQKEIREKARARSITDIRTSPCDHTPSSVQSLNSSPDENIPLRNNNGGLNGGLLHFLGFHFNKSETRHLDRTVNSNSTQSDIDKVSRRTTEESRYTKLPLTGSVGNKSKHTPQTSSSLFHIQGKKSSKHLKGKSKSDNQLHRISVGHLQATNLSTSTSRVENDYCEQKLNSVQVGDHATISLPWKQNNLSSVTQHKFHPNTHNNIGINFLRFGNSVESRKSESGPSQFFGRQRSKSLERASTFRISGKDFLSNISTHVNSNVVSSSSSPLHDRFAERANSLECHPHRRVRKILNKREQEILLRHISPPELLTPQTTAPLPSQIPPEVTTVDSKIIERKKSLEREVLSIEDDRITSPSERVRRIGRVEVLKVIHKPTDIFPDRISTSVENSPRSPNSSSPGAFSCPPSPPPRPPSTLKTHRSRLISSSEKAKALTPSPTPTPTKTLLSTTAFPFPPIMEHSSSHIQPTSRHSGETCEGHHGGGGLTMSSVEDARSSGFINKPTKGWLHSDKLLTKEGVTYAVRYIGCHDVNTSMKCLDFDTRSLIAKECINQVCEAAGFKSIDRKRKIDRRLVKILGMKPRLEHAGSDVCLTITSTCIKLTSLDNGAVITVHEMPNISFASGGDVTMLDFVAYVAKDSVVGRACFVLECGTGLAQDVITTIGQAFELRFKEYLQKRPPPHPKVGKDDPEYYNDLPGKLPPETHPPKMMAKLPSNGQRTRPTPTLTLDPSSDKEMAVNLIDFEAPTPPGFGQLPSEKSLESLLLGNGGNVLTPTDDANGGGDPFDMQTLSGALGIGRRLTADEQRRELEAESWFHGIVSRGEAEALVIIDGDFLVRESQTSPNQYVLTGLQNGTPKHLLLVDPEGVVRTKDRTFESVSHLIRHHSDSSRPIISAESIVLLRTPVMKPNP